MSNINLPNSNIYIRNDFGNSSVQTSIDKSAPPKDAPKDNKILYTSLAVLGVLGIAGVAIYAISRGKGKQIIKPAEEKASEKTDQASTAIKTELTNEHKSSSKSNVSSKVEEPNSKTESPKTVSPPKSSEQVKPKKEQPASVEKDWKNSVMESIRNSRLKEGIKAALQEEPDEKILEMISKNLPGADDNGLQFLDLGFIKPVILDSFIKEIPEVAEKQAKIDLLKKAIKVCGNDEDRTKILENLIKIINDPKSPEAQDIIRILGEASENCKKIMEISDGNFDFYAYSRMKNVVEEEKLSTELSFIRPDSIVFFGRTLFKLGKTASSSQDELYFMEKFLNIFEKSPFAFADQWTMISTLDDIAKIEELKPRVEKQITAMIMNDFPELKDLNLSINAQKALLSEIIKKDFKGVTNGKHYLKISTILDTLKSNAAQGLTEEEKKSLNDLAKQIAQKAGKRYAEALCEYERTGYFNLHIKPEDESKILNLDALHQNQFFNEDEMNVAWEYIECQDSNYGAFFINDLLRNDPEIFNTYYEPGSLFEHVIDELDRLTTDKAFATTEDSLVFRVLNPTYEKDYEKLNVGDEIIDKGFVSTTAGSSAGACGYLGYFGGPQGSNYVAKITLPKGTTGCNMRRYRGEGYAHNEELVLPRNSKFRVLSVDHEAKIIEAEYILPDC